MITSDSDYFLLEIKPSTIVNAGIGLFAKADLPAGIIVAEYRGTIFLKETKSKTVSFSDKSINLNEDCFILGDNCAACYINDIVNLEESKKGKKLILHSDKKYNCRFSKSHHKLFVITTDEIKEGDELFIGYGEQYWLSRWN